MMKQKCTVRKNYLNLCQNGEITVIRGFHRLSFALLVAPFGGFFASAIKRAYGKKDFASLIPGHGGLMDRFDCQFLMMYFVSVYYNTFVK